METDRKTQIGMLALILALMGIIGYALLATPSTAIWGDTGSPGTACIGTTANFTCGQEVTESCTLDGDLSFTGTCFNITTDNITLDCNGSALTGTADGSYAVVINGTAQNITIQNCVFNFTLYSKTNSFYGVEAIGGATNLTIANSTFLNNTAGIDARSIAPGSVNISGNTFTDGESAMVLAGQGGIYYYDLLIQDNVGTGLNWSSLPAGTHNGAFSARSFGGNALIKGNNLSLREDNTKILVELLSNDNFTLEGNQFTARETEYGVNTWIRLCTNTTVANNTFKWGTDGIAFQDDSDTLIENNTFIENRHHAVIYQTTAVNTRNYTSRNNRAYNSTYNCWCSYPINGFVNEGFTIENDLCDGAGWTGLWAGYGSGPDTGNWTINNFTAINIGRRAIEFTAGAIKAKIYNSNLTGGMGGFFSSATGTAGYIIIENTTAHDSPFGFSIGSVGDQTPVPSFSNNTMTGNDAGLILVRMQDSNFSGNLYDSNNYSLKLDGYAGGLNNNTFSGDIMNNSGVDAIYINNGNAGASSNLFKEVIIENSTGYDVNIASVMTEAHMLNSTFNESKLNIAGGTWDSYIFKEWYFDAHIEECTEYALGVCTTYNASASAKINAIDTTGTSRVNGTTDAGGNSTVYVPEYVFGLGGIVQLNNYTMNATKGGYIRNETIMNITASTGANFTLENDTSAPEIIFTGATPANGSNISTNTFTIEATQTDEYPLNTTIYVYNSTLGLINETTGVASASVTFLLIVPGTYYFNATAYDYNGNYNQTETRQVTLNFSSCLGATYAFVCGDTVTESCTFDGNLTHGSGACLTFGADSIMMDGAGYSITGNSSGQGINCGSNTGVLVANLSILNETDGVVCATGGNTFDNMSISTMANVGFYLQYSDANAISGANITDSPYGAYILGYSGAGGNSVTNSILTNNGVGIFSASINSNLSNNALSIGQRGIVASGAAGEYIEYNNVTGMALAGIELEATATGNNITGNHIYLNAGKGLYLSSTSSNAITGNNMTGNGYDVWLESIGAQSVFDDTNTLTDGGVVRQYTPTLEAFTSEFFSYATDPFIGRGGGTWTIINNTLNGRREDWDDVPLKYYNDTTHHTATYKRVETNFTISSENLHEYTAAVAVINLQDVDIGGGYYGCWEQYYAGAWYLGIYRCNNQVCASYVTIATDAGNAFAPDTEYHMTFEKNGTSFACEIPGLSSVSGTDGMWSEGYEGIGVYFGNITFDNTNITWNGNVCEASANTTNLGLLILSGCDGTAISGMDSGANNSHSIYLRDTTNANVTGSSLNGSYYGIYFDATSTGNSVIDSTTNVISPETTSGANYLINSTYGNRTYLSGTAGFYTCWHATFHATDEFGLPAVGVAVYASDKDATTWMDGSRVTNSSGYLEHHLCQNYSTYSGGWADTNLNNYTLTGDFAVVNVTLVRNVTTNAEYDFIMPNTMTAANITFIVPANGSVMYQFCFEANATSRNITMPTWATTGTANGSLAGNMAPNALMQSQIGSGDTYEQEVMAHFKVSALPSIYNRTFGIAFMINCTGNYVTNITTNITTWNGTNCSGQTVTIPINFTREMKALIPSWNASILTNSSLLVYSGTGGGMVPYNATRKDIPINITRS